MPFINIEEIPEREMIPGYTAKFIHTDTSTIAHWTVKSGSILPLHSHIHEQITQVVSGEFEMTIGDETIKLGAGQTAVVPSNVLHGATALTDVVAIDFFNPARADYKEFGVSC